MYKAGLTKTGKIVVGKYSEQGTLLFLLRRGHDIQADGRGRGELLVWKSAEGAQMYAQLLNRGRAV